MDWCQWNYLLISVGKTKRLVVDFFMLRPATLTPENIQGVDFYIGDSQKYLGVDLNKKLDLVQTTDALCSCLIHLLQHYASVGMH